MRYSVVAAGLGPGSWAIGSAGERLVHTEEVTGSIPVSPTQVSGRFRAQGPAFLIFRQQQTAATIRQANR
jgi:hypothetical protein